jgi:hypothetical protein
VGLEAQEGADVKAVENGVLQQLSVSQVESFDHAQTGGCHRRWYFERVEGRRPEQDDAQSEGEAGHALFATYLRTGAFPGRTLMGKHVREAINKGELPAPGPDLQVERRFSGQPQYDAAGNWVPLDTSKTLWLAGVPWEGFIDLRFRRTDVPELWDHKFSSDIHEYAKAADALIKTVQMPIYAVDSLRQWADAPAFRLVHHYVSRAKAGDSFIRSAVVPVEQVLERRVHVEALVGEMKAVARATSQEDVPFNKKACAAWRGCPHQSICSAFKRRTAVSLSAEELALFDDVPAAPPAAPEPAAPLPAETEPALAAIVPAEAAPTVPPPAKSKRRVKIQDEAPPTCPACGYGLGEENASQLRDGTWVHVGCTAVKHKSPPASTTATPIEPVRTATPPPAPAVATVSAPSPVPTPAVQASDLPLPAEPGSVWRIASDFQILSVDGDRVTVSIRLEALLSKLLR